MATAFPKLRHFVAGEFDHPEMMDHKFLLWLDKVREQCGVQFLVTDDGRTPEENQKLLSAGASTTSLHLLGRAVDFVPRVRKDQTISQALWCIAEAVIDRAGEAPGGVELEIVRSSKDFHCHIGVFPDRREPRLVIKAD